MSTHDTAPCAESWRLYQLPEFPWPPELQSTFSWDGLPPASSVATYLKAFARKFGLDASVRLRHEVTYLQRSAGAPHSA